MHLWEHNVPSGSKLVFPGPRSERFLSFTGSLLAGLSSTIKIYFSSFMHVYYFIQYFKLHTQINKYIYYYIYLSHRRNFHVIVQSRFMEMEFEWVWGRNLKLIGRKTAYTVLQFILLYLTFILFSVSFFFSLSFFYRSIEYDL